MKSTFKRFFAFGCSFTDYIWPTWADAVGYNMLEYYNYGCSGSGNNFAFNHVSQADQHYNFNKDDLVIVCWTNVMREDRMISSDWLSPGNIYSQDVYDQQFVKKYCDDEGFFVRDIAYIKAVKDILEKSKCTWYFLSMVPVDKIFDQWDSTKTVVLNEARTLYKNVLESIRPSYFEIIFNNDWHSLQRPNTVCDGKLQPELHPTPAEHLLYLDKVLPEVVVSQQSKNWIHEWNDKIWNEPVDTKDYAWRTLRQQFRNKKAKL